LSIAYVKNSKDHIGQKIKRLRAFKGMTQEDLAIKVEKTRSLISYIERTGNINKQTLKEIILILESNPEEFELKSVDFFSSNKELKKEINDTPTNAYEILIRELKDEITYLKKIIDDQLLLLKEKK
jgi:transcriptional regulator with XRE-family HTH domain